MVVVDRLPRHRFRERLVGQDRRGAHREPAGLAGCCEKFAAAAQTLQADPPAPVAKVNALWQTALADAAKSGRECATAIDTVNPALMDRSTADLTASMSALDQMTAQIK